MTMTIAFPELFGSKCDAIRKEIIRRGGKPNNKAQVWEMDAETFAWVEQQLGKKLGVVPAVAVEAIKQMPGAPKPATSSPISLPVPPVPSQEAVPAAPTPSVSLLQVPSTPLRLVKPAPLVGPTAQTNKEVLKIAASRFARVNIETHGPRSQRQLSRDVKKEKREGDAEGIDRLTVRTVNEREIYNPDEFEAAQELQGKLGYMLRRLGTSMGGGFIVFPLTAEKEFDETKQQAITKAREFNLVSRNWKVSVTATKYQAMMSDEEEAAKRVTWEIQQSLRELEEAVVACDVERIRSVATEAKSKIPTLAAGFAVNTLSGAIDRARELATKIVKEVEKKGEDIRSVQKTLDTSVISSARMMFDSFAVPEELDLSSPSAPSVQEARFTGGDVDVVINGDD